MRKDILLISFLCFVNFAIAQSPNFEWVKNIAGEKDETMNSLKSDSQGNLYVAGNFNSASVNFSTTVIQNTTNIEFLNFRDGFFAKYNANGDVIWIKTVGGMYNESIESIAVDSSGNSYVYGTYSSPTLTLGAFTLINPNLTSSEFYGQTAYMDFLAKYDANGNVLWAKQFGSTIYNQAYSIDVDAIGDLVITGGFGGLSITLGAETFLNTNTLGLYYHDLFISKLDTNGNFIWSKKAGGWGDDYMTNSKFDSQGNIVISGQSMSQIFYFEDEMHSNYSTQPGTNINNYNSDFFMAKYDPSGNKIWFKSGGSTSNEFITSFDIDAADNILLAGCFTGATCSFDNITLDGTSGSLFLAKLNSAGERIWCRNTGIGNSSAKSETLKLDPSGTIYLSGSFAGSNNFDGISASCLVNYCYSFFVSRFNANGVCEFIKNTDSITHQIMQGYERIAFNDQGDLYFVGDYRGFTNSFDSITFSDQYNSQNSFVTKINHTNLASEQFNIGSASVYPNPTKDVLYLQGYHTVFNEPFSITDASGRFINKGVLTAQNQINVRDLSSGIYLLILKNQSVKFIKQ